MIKGKSQSLTSFSWSNNNNTTEVPVQFLIKENVELLFHEIPRTITQIRNSQTVPHSKYYHFRDRTTLIEWLHSGEFFHKKILTLNKFVHPSEWFIKNGINNWWKVLDLFQYLIIKYSCYVIKFEEKNTNITKVKHQEFPGSPCPSKCLTSVTFVIEREPWKKRSPKGASTEWNS